MIHAFSLSPNPANKNVTIELDEALINSNISITDIFGKEVYSLDAISNKQTQIDLSFLSNGVYFVRIGNGEEQRVVKLVRE